MTFSTFITPTLASLQSVSTQSASGYDRNLETHVQDFWSSFPCPPPWKPRLLIEVNASRFAPVVSKTLRSFLAGKCDILHVLSGADTPHNFETDDFIPGFDLRPTENPGLKSSIGHPATSHHRWCDATCQLFFGCAIFVVVAVITMSLIICVNKHRVRHKMAATQPSRQQLQLSTSTSYAVNCEEFPHLEVRGEDMFYPPFRHRGLPNPPRSCHPSCDSSWNCPNCSSCHPLMRLSSSDHLYSHTYSAVYETIEDIDEEECLKTEDENKRRGTTPIISEPKNVTKSCVPCMASSTDVNTVQLQPNPCCDKKDSQAVAETIFNGEDRSEITNRPTLPKYFDLEKKCALYRPYESINQDPTDVNSADVGSVRHDCRHLDVTHHDRRAFFPVPRQYPTLVDTSKHSFHISQGHQTVIPSASELYKSRSEAESRSFTEPTNEGLLKMSSKQTSNCGRGHSDSRPVQLHSGHNNSYINGQRDTNWQHKQTPLNAHNFKPYKTHVCTATSSFFPNIPSYYYCPTCQQDKHAYKASLQSVSATREQQNGAFFLEASVAPDLLKETSNHSRSVINEVKSGNIRRDNN